MNSLKRLSGIIWIVLGVATVFMMSSQAVKEISAASAANKAVLDTRMFWYIIIPIFAPVMAGLCLFGWYAWKGEYDEIARDSEHF
ncbi:MAG: hypothetical protein RJA20_1761 [Bacteroidota bacterium]|jgi:hypothetical protein